MHVCCICKSVAVELLMDFDKQPMSNRFLSSIENEEFKHPFCLGYCKSCSLVQLINPASRYDLRARFNWITYQEPEGHLDKLVEMISQLSGITSKSSFLGVSDYEDSTLERLRKKNFLQTWRLVLDQDLGTCDSFSVIETIQRYLTHKNIKKITNNNTYPQVIIVRDLLEHAHDPLSFMYGLRDIVLPNGYVVFEVPDYSKNFSLCDYSSLWEEHISYFSPYTFINSLEMGGFTIEKLNLYPYDMQDYLVAITRPNHKKYFSKQDKKTQSTEQKRVHHFSTSFQKRQSWYRSVLSAYRERGKIALLGAGHTACHFINLMNVGDLIDFLLDDHPHKGGMFMPGSKLPILPSTALEDESVKFCLLSLSQESEQKVIANNKKFIDRGGQFSSIFSTSKNALRPSFYAR